MSKTEAPIIRRIPAEAHAQAAAMGMHAEVYAEVMAGHGVTGNVAWALSRTVEHHDFTDMVSFRSGTARNFEYAMLDLRHAINER